MKDKTSKATGPESISEALEDFGIDKIAILLNKICATGQIAPDISKSIFIAFPKKLGATECEFHRMVGFMSHFKKISLRITMMRVQNKIK